MCGLRKRIDDRTLAIAVLALVVSAGLLTAQPGGWIDAPSWDVGTAVLNAWPPSGDAVFAWLLSEYAFAQSVNVAPVLTPAGNIDTSSTGSPKLNGADDITIFESGDSRYAIISANAGHAVQILNITNPASITVAGSITDGTDNAELTNADEIVVFESGDSRYAIISATRGHAVQILNITNPASITTADKIVTSSSVELDNPRGIAVYESGGSRYAAIAVTDTDGVQILNITNPASITAADNVINGGNLELDGARGIAVFESGDSRYAVVTGYNDDGVQTLNITDPDSITPADRIIHTPGSIYLDAPHGIAIYESGDSRYAAIAVTDTDGVQILDITDPHNIAAAGSIINSTNLNGAWDIAVFESGNSRYAAVTAYTNNSVQMLDITDPDNITTAGNVINTADLELNKPRGIAIYKSEGSYYAAIAAYTDDGVQIIGLGVMSAEMVVPPIPPANTPPTVTAGPNLLVTKGLSVHLTGASAADVDSDDVLSYSWSQNPAGTVTFDDAASLNPTVTAPLSGTATSVALTLSVNDGTNDAVTDTMTLTIQDPPPSFVSSILDRTSGALEIIFSEDIDVTPATNVVPAKIHIRESGNYTGGGITLLATELDTTVDGTTISFALNASRLATVVALAVPELTIEPGAVQDTSGDLIEGTFDASTAVFIDATLISSQEVNPSGMAFSNDGTKMYVIGVFSNEVNEYALSPAFDASTRRYTDAFTGLINQDNSPTDMAFSNDGTRMFILGTENGGRLHEYTLSTPFDVSHAAFANTTSISETATPTGIAFSNDGTKMFIIGSTGSDVNEYTLTIPFNATTRTFVNATSFSSPLLTSVNMAFSNDGTKMFVLVFIGFDRDEVHEYTLSTPFDASTTTFIDATSISAQEQSPKGMAFSNDGSKMFVIGDAGDDVNEYALSSVYPITVISAAAGTDAFITTWQTTSANQSIKIPVEVHSGKDFTINWGDGNTTEVNSNGIQSHTYATADTYRVTMTGDLSRINLGGSGSTPTLLHSINQWGDIKWSNMNGAFGGATTMTHNATDTPDLSQVTDMSHMFNDAHAFNGDISGWNTSSVTNMSHMFNDASEFNRNLSSWNTSSITNMSYMFTSANDFNGDLSSWNTSSVTNMRDMFSHTNAFNGDISGWDTSSVTSMSHMFDGAVAFTGDLSEWDVSKVITMSHMFDGAVAFTGDLSEWDVSKVITMSHMFDGAVAFTGDLSEWDVSKVEYMDIMFRNAHSFDSDLSEWDVSKVTTMLFMFSSAFDFDSDISEWNVSQVTDMENMFYFATSFDQNLGPWYIVLDNDSIDLRNADTTTIGVISPQNSALAGQTGAYGIGQNHDSGMFEINGTSLDIKADTDYTTKTDYTINITSTHPYGTDNHHLVDVTVTESVDPATTFVTTWQTASAGESITIPVGDATGNYTVHWGDDSTSTHITDADHTYTQAGSHTVSISGDFTRIHLFDDANNAGKLASIDQWGDISWTTMQDAFRGASNMAYNADDAPNLSGATSMHSMFRDTSFSADLSTWNVSSVTDTSRMFQSSSFNGDLSGWNVSQVQSMRSMFSDASSFNQPLDTWNVSSVTNMAYMFYDTDRFNQDLDTWTVSSVESMEYMFGSSNTNAAFNGNISAWDVSSVTNMGYMFNGASSFDQPLNDWNVSQVQNMRSMFLSASSFDQPLDDWNISSVTDMNNMFFNAADFDQNLGPWYITPDSVDFSYVDSLNVTDITPQNNVLAGHNPVYDIVAGGNFTLFEIVSGSDTLAFKATPTSNGLHQVNVTATGGSVFESGNNYHIMQITVSDILTDNTPPRVASILRDTPSVASTPLTTLVFNVTFNEPVTNVNDDDFTVTGTGTGTISGVSGSGTSYQVTVTVAAVGTIGLDIASGHNIQDAANNGLTDLTTTGSDETYTVTDSTPPRVTSILRDTPSVASTSATTLVFAVTFDEPVINVNNADFAVTGTGTGTISGVSGSGTSYQVTVTVAAVGTIGLDIASGHNIQDAANNGLTDLTTTGSDETYTVTDNNSFLTTWETTAANPAVSIPVEVHSGETFTIDWGDGTPIATVNSNGTQSHTYATAGSYRVTMTGDLSRINLGGSGSTPTLLDSINQWGDIQWSTMNSAFRGASDMTYNAADTPDLSQVTDMSDMFRLATAFNGDISDWDVSSVTDMSSLFSGANAFNKSLVDWDVSSVTDMSNMFYFARAFNGDISGWNTSSVTDMSQMFDSADTFNGDISGWNTSSVTNMSGMFDFAEKFNRDISGWDVSSVTNMDDMFDHADDFDQNLGPWYITPDSVDFSYVDSLNVTDITPQNDALAGHNPVYDIGTGGNFTLFEIVSGSDTLAFKATPTSTGVYNVNVTASDGTVFEDGNNHRVIRVTVSDILIDSTPPRVASILRDTPSVPSTPLTTLVFNVTFNEPVINVDAADFAVTGTGTGTVTDVSGDGTSYLVTVTVDDVGTIGLDIALGHNIQDAANNPLDNPTPTDDDETYTVTDSTPPRVTSILRDTPSVASTTATTLVFNVTFNEPVINVGVADFDVAGNGTGSISNVSGSGASYTVTVTVTGAGTIGLDIASGHDIQDAANNPLANLTPTGSDETYTVTETTVPDSTPPRVTSILRDTPSVASTTATTLVFAVTFDEPVTNVDAADFTVTGTGTGTISGVSGSGASYRVIVTVDNVGIIGLDIASGHDIQDAANNPLVNLTTTGSDETYTVTETTAPDSTPPHVVSILRNTPLAESTTATTLVFAVTFDEPVTNVDAADFTVTGTGTGTISGVTGTDTSYTVTVTVTDVGTIGLDIVLNHDIKDTTNNDLTDLAPTDNDETYTVTVTDNTPPHVVSILRNIPLAESTTATTLVFAVTFDESVINVNDTADFTVTGSGTGTISGVSGSGASYRVTVTVTASGTIGLDIASGHDIKDTADNDLTDTTVVGSNETYIVNQLPVLNNIPSQTGDELTLLTFTAEATDRDNDPLTYSLIGTIPDGATMDTNTGVFSWTPTETQDGIHTVTVQVSDGNGGGGTDLQDVTITVTEVNQNPVLDSIGGQTIDETDTLKFDATARDDDIYQGSPNSLTFSLGDGADRPRGASITRDGSFSWRPDQSQDGVYSINVTVSDGRGGTASELVSVTINDIAPRLVSVRGSDSSITLTLSEPVNTRGTGSGGFTVSSSSSGNTVTVESITGSGTDTLTLLLDGPLSRGDTLSYDSSTGDIVDEFNKDLESFVDAAILLKSKKSGTAPPSVDTLEINGQSYNAQNRVNHNATPLEVAVDQPISISFTAHDRLDILYFAVYLNLQDDDMSYTNSDTYVEYNRGQTNITDPQDLLSDASLTVSTDPDDSTEKTVTLDITFAEPIGNTNMVIRTWNADNESSIVIIVDALNVIPMEVDPEPQVTEVDPEPQVPAVPNPEPETETFADDFDYDRALFVLRMWSGFESEIADDNQLLTVMGLTHMGTDIPAWVMTDLAPLVVKELITLDEFRVALEYVMGNT